MLNRFRLENVSVFVCFCECFRCSHVYVCFEDDVASVKAYKTEDETTKLYFWYALISAHGKCPINKCSNLMKENVQQIYVDISCVCEVLSDVFFLFLFLSFIWFLPYKQPSHKHTHTNT